MMRHLRASPSLLNTASLTVALGCLLVVQSISIRPARLPLINQASVLNRRSLLSSGLVIGSAAFIPSSGDQFASSADDRVPFKTFQVEADGSFALNPKLTSVDNTDFVDKISAIQGGAIWLGEHHNSDADHSLQVQLLRRIVDKRRSDEGASPTAIGLEQVQVKFQPVLDAFVAGKISSQEMRTGVEWDTRWIWPFEGYLPVFETARELHLPLIALNVNSEDATLVEKGGLPSLPRERMQQYIRDPPGFAAFAVQPEFRAYVDYVIQPSYRLHRDMGLLQTTMSGEKLEQQMSLRNFLSGRILWDEAMASNAYEWTRRNDGGLMIGIVGADHVKFRNGIPGRYSRMASGTACISILLNPTPIDTLPSGASENTDAAMSSQSPESLMLQLRYLNKNVADEGLLVPESSGGVLPLADYLVIGR